jgi:hypothetical protein
MIYKTGGPYREKFFQGFEKYGNSRPDQFSAMAEMTCFFCATRSIAADAQT